MENKELKNKKGFTEREFLSVYDDTKYKKPSVTVDMLLFTVADEQNQNYRKLPEKVLKILMVKRADHPYIGKWALPGGFISINEGLELAALRELKEEVNIDSIYIEQLYTWGDIDRDPRTRVISCSYFSVVDISTLNIKAGDDAKDAKWFTVKRKQIRKEKRVTKNGFITEDGIKIELSCDTEKLSAIINIVNQVEGNIKKESIEIIEENGIAFDHAKIINYGIERLRNKIKYTDIAFKLMPSFFSLTDLQKVYEAILDKELLKANFRRKISKMVIETNNQTKDKGHRPSKLYKFNPDWMERAF